MSKCNLFVIFCLLGFRLAAALEILIHNPSNYSCVGPNLPIECEMVLGQYETLDGLLALHHQPRICMAIDGRQQTCFHLDAGIIMVENVTAGCHSLVASLEGSPVQSIPVIFQAPEVESNLCTRLDRCVLPSEYEQEQVRQEIGDLLLKMQSPRDGDIVYGDSVVVSLVLETRNGTRLTPRGRVCLMGRRETYGEEDEFGCIEVDRHMYSEGLTIDLIVRGPQEGERDGRASFLRLNPSFEMYDDNDGEKGENAVDVACRSLEGRRRRMIKGKESTIIHFEPIQRRIYEEVLLGEEALDADPALLPSLPVVLVLCHYEEDLGWMLIQPYPVIIYEKKPAPQGHANKASRHAVPVNVAGEASAFLKFIIDYYETLPERAIFLHSHRFAYHQEDILIILHRLRNRLNATEYCNINKVVWGNKEDPERTYLKHHWQTWLGKYFGDLPDVILERCCAQFVVHRDRIRRQPKEFFQEALERMYACKISREESRKCGLLMEWIWHYVFAEDAIQAAYLKPVIPLLPHSDRIALSKRPVCFD